MDEKKERPPWALAIGVALLVFAVLAALLARALSPVVLVIGVVGLVLLCAGLIQRSIEQTRRQ